MGEMEEIGEIINFNPCFLGFQQEDIMPPARFFSLFQSLFSWISTEAEEGKTEIHHTGISILVFLDFNLFGDISEIS